MAFQVTVKVPELPSELREGFAERVVRDESIRAADEGLILVRNEMVGESQFGGTNTLRSGWITDVARAKANVVAGRVITTAVQALVIDEGTRRNPRPPSRNLSVWIRRKLGITAPRAAKRAAFAVSKAIKRRGLPRSATEKGKFTKAFFRLSGTVDRIMQRMQERIGKRLI